MLSQSRLAMLLGALLAAGCASRGVGRDDRPDDLPGVNGQECTGPGWTTVSPDPEMHQEGDGLVCRKDNYYVIVNPSPSGQGVASHISCPSGYASLPQELDNGHVRPGILSCYKEGPNETLLVCQISDHTVQTNACPEGELATWEPVKRGMSPEAVSRCRELECVCHDYTALDMLRHVKVEMRPNCCLDYSGPPSTLAGPDCAK